MKQTSLFAFFGGGASSSSTLENKRAREEKPSPKTKELEDDDDFESDTEAKINARKATPRKRLKKATEKETEKDEEAEEATSQRTPNGGRPSTPTKARSKNTTTSPYFPSAGGAKTDASPVSFLAGLKMRKRVSAEQLLNASAEREEIMLDDEQQGKGKEKHTDEEQSKQGRSIGTFDPIIA